MRFVNMNIWGGSINVIRPSLWIKYLPRVPLQSGLEVDVAVTPGEEFGARGPCTLRLE